MTDTTAQAAMIEAIAKAIYCHKGHLPAPWDKYRGKFKYDWDVLRMEVESQAAAVLALVWPKPLVWVADPRQDYKRLIASAHGFTYHVDTSYSGPEAWLWIYENGNSVTKRTEKPQPNEAAAQAVAQAHADAAHWSGTGLGDLITATQQGGQHV
jgi:hypothetical protein